LERVGLVDVSGLGLEYLGWVLAGLLEGDGLNGLLAVGGRLKV
jgi:hypothetical protein